MADKLTDGQRWLLGTCPFFGLSDGSNMWPLVDLETETGRCDGAEVDTLFRSGLIVAAPLPEPKFVQTGGGDIPDLEATHLVDITPAGRQVLEAKPCR